MPLYLNISCASNAYPPGENLIISKSKDPLQNHVEALNLLKGHYVKIENHTSESLKTIANRIYQDYQQNHSNFSLKFLAQIRIFGIGRLLNSYMSPSVIDQSYQETISKLENQEKVTSQNLVLSRCETLEEYRMQENFTEVKVHAKNAFNDFSPFDDDSDLVSKSIMEDSFTIVATTERIKLYEIPNIETDDDDDSSSFSSLAEDFEKSKPLVNEETEPYPLLSQQS